jgi:hypothetical protein
MLKLQKRSRVNHTRCGGGGGGGGAAAAAASFAHLCRCVTLR